MYRFYSFIRYFTAGPFMKSSANILLIFLLAMAGTSTVFGQAVNSPNFNYLHNLQSEVEMRLSPVVRGDSIVLYFSSVGQ